jgi:hypothetical protein
MRELTMEELDKVAGGHTGNPGTGLDNGKACQALEAHTNLTDAFQEGAPFPPDGCGSYGMSGHTGSNIPPNS